MIDRLKHQIISLENNITVYYLPDSNAGYGEARIIIPFGHAYNTGDIPQGSFHFLEHMVLDCSKRYPKKDAFESFVIDNGGYINGGTGNDLTSYEISIPTECFTEAFKGLASHVFEPIFTEENLANHKQVIRNERIRSTPYYPSNTELGQYIRKSWLNIEPVSLNQVFGTDEDLNNFDIPFLEKLHTHYFTKPVTVVIGGTLDIDAVLDTLKVIPIQITSKTLPISIQPFNILKKEFHEHAFKEVERFEYRFLLMVSDHSYELSYGLAFLSGYLINQVGPIYKWLRDENSWVYELGKVSFFSNETKQSIFGIRIPLSDMYQVETVRKELDGRIVNALKDNDRIQRYFDRAVKKEIFLNETVSDRINTLEGYRFHYGKTYAGEDWLKVVEKYRKENALLDLYNYIKEKGEFTEFLAKPLEK